MYLARFSLDDQDFVQVVFRVGAEPLALEEAQSWQRDIDRFLGALATVQPLWIAQRLSLRKRQLTRHWAITVSVNDEQALLRWSAGLVCVACASRRTVDWIASREAHDEVFQCESRTMVRLTPPLFDVDSHSSAPVWIGAMLAVDALLDPLIRAALISGKDLLIQHTFTWRASNAQTLRALKHNVARLTELPGVGEDRLAAMRAVVDGYSDTTHFTTVTLAADGQDAESWMRGAVAVAARGTPYAPDVDLSTDRFGGTELAIDTDLHPDGPRVALACVPFSVLGNVLSWTPVNLPHELLEWLTPVDPIVDKLDAAVTVGPSSVGIHDPFVFVSYCRRDGPALSCVLRALDDIGIMPWWDNEIPGGDEWLQHLELRLDRCASVVALISEEAGQSRFVRNELTYAHILGKKVIPIKLDDAPLAPGLRIVLAHRNWIQADDPDLVQLLKRALTDALS
jgi:hypothetical protein